MFSASFDWPFMPDLSLYAVAVVQEGMSVLPRTPANKI
jgi:hypothetical protein